MNLVGRVVDIIGTITILGLILRYGSEAGTVLTAASTSFNSVYRSVALIDVPNPRV